MFYLIMSSLLRISQTFPDLNVFTFRKTINPGMFISRINKKYITNCRNELNLFRIIICKILIATKWTTISQPIDVGNPQSVDQ